MYYNYSTRIKELRFQRNMTQAQLAEGICSQALISKIEKNDIHPDIEVVAKIAQRLDVSVGYLLGETGTHAYQPNIFNIYNDHIILLLNNHAYQDLEYYLQRDTPEIVHLKENIPYYLWIQSIIAYFNYNRKEYAIQLLQEAIETIAKHNELTPEMYEIQLNIYNTIGSFLSEIEDFQNAIDYYQQGLTLFNISSIKNDYKIKILYGIARTYGKNHEYKNSTFYANKGIQLTIESNSINYLDDFLLILANNYLQIQQYEKARHYLNITKTISELKQNRHLLPYIEKTEFELSENES